MRANRSAPAPPARRSITCRKRFRIQIRKKRKTPSRRTAEICPKSEHALVFSDIFGPFHDVYSYGVVPMRRYRDINGTHPWTVRPLDGAFRWAKAARRRPLFSILVSPERRQCNSIAYQPKRTRKDVSLSRRRWKRRRWRWRWRWRWTGQGESGAGVRSIIIRSNGGGGGGSATRRADGQIHNVSRAGRSQGRRRGFLGRAPAKLVEGGRRTKGLAFCASRPRRRPFRAGGARVRASSSSSYSSFSCSFSYSSSTSCSCSSPPPPSSSSYTVVGVHSRKQRRIFVCNQSSSGFADLIKFPDRALCYRRGRYTTTTTCATVHRVHGVFGRVRAVPFRSSPGP